ncbi:MAG: hypothetical protein DCC67_10145 [Planctomycetota bacterium]|nr:MAG: hypothetical protein DCC67_10145 [Planctomycetota bacterium]
MNHPLRWLSLIALDRPVLPDFADVAAWHAERFPEAPQPAASASTDKLLTFTIGDYTAAATLVPRPIPWTQLEGPAATAWYWPDAAEALRRHQAHLLVAVIDEGGRAVEKAAILTRLTTALVAASPSVGVFWGPGRLVHHPGAFVEQAVQMRDDNLPLFLWIDFRIEQTEEDGLRLYTTGLEALGQTELETAGYAGEAQELLNYAYNIAHYQIDQRKLIRDGDTIGLADEVQVTARRGPSMLGGDLEVLQLQFEISGPRDT